MQKQVVKQEPKRPYTQPQLVKHGAVESLTLGGNYGGSRPWWWN